MSENTLLQRFLEGNALMNSGDLLAAEKCFMAALEINAQSGEVIANLAFLRELQGDLLQAEHYYRQALILLPTTIQIYLNLGVMLVKQKRFAEAEFTYRVALQIDPYSPGSWSNYGVLLACMKREEEAEQCYRKALTIDPSYPKARFNLSYILLRQARFEEGLLSLESRDWQDLFSNYFYFPRWQGESLQGKSILICFEGGFGDMIQFSRYASVLKANGASRVSLICHPALTALFDRMPELDDVYSYHLDVDKSGWDYWVPLISLPFLCGTRLESIPAHIPYLRADPEKIASFSSLFSDKTFKVGLVWQGNTLFENNDDRSIPQLAMLSPVLELDGMEFISLQKGAGESQIHQYAGLRVVPGGEFIQDFADTAALISQLDLVITVDTSVAHLTGALGKTCWVLLPDYRADWRWMTARDDSPWYPEVMRLFRQQPDENWTAVARRVATELEIWKAVQFQAAK
ncbi:tetratricopeptide repeat protein [Undibacterium sp. RuRC25W]|uniref:tetratricopeptide repeat-containing glycosyltransferase family protein n=1 Tax=Undibacterium sp. RuRC25W TaxID=3413047 RepID=UPI003BF4035F